MSRGISIVCEFIDHMVSEGFLVQGFRDMVLMDANPDGLLDKIINFSPPQIDKWWVDRKKDKRSEVQKLRVQGLEK